MRKTQAKKKKYYNYNHLSKRNKNENVTAIKQVPLNPCKQLQRLSKIDEKYIS